MADPTRHPAAVTPVTGPRGTTARASVGDADETTCPRCGESRDLAKVKGCVKCLSCGFKFDCNGW